MNTGTMKSPGVPRRSSSSAAVDPSFLPGETGRELDAGRMNEAAEAVAREERRLGRRLTGVERGHVTLPIYRR